MHDKYKKRHQAPKAGDRVRHQIAVEAARRLLDVVGPAPDDPSGRLREAGESEYYAAKRRAAAVLGHRVRPGDLPSDSEVREQVLSLVRSRGGRSDHEQPEPEPGEQLAMMADHLDRFAIYKLRLEPLERIKQNPKHHPEGDALYHSLQVFDRARAVRPYDEEFLLAALLHDVGKAIEPNDHVNAAVEALRGAVTERTLWLVENQIEPQSVDRARSPRTSHGPELAADLDDLELLRELDDAGRVPGAPVGTVDEALAYVKGLEDEDYLRK